MVNELYLNKAAVNTVLKNMIWLPYKGMFYYKLMSQKDVPVISLSKKLHMKCFILNCKIINKLKYITPKKGNAVHIRIYHILCNTLAEMGPFPIMKQLNITLNGKNKNYKQPQSVQIRFDPNSSKIL